MRLRMRIGAACLWLGLLLPATHAVDKSKFRKCQDTGFCKRHRTPVAATPPVYALDRESVAKHGVNGVSAQLIGGAAGSPNLLMTTRFYDNGVTRVKITESVSGVTRWESADVLMEDALTLVEPSVLAADAPGLPAALASTDATRLNLGYGSTVLSFGISPFGIEMYVDGDLAVTANARGLFHFEHHREKGASTTVEAAVEHHCEDGFAWGGEDCKEIVGYWEDGLARFEDGSKEVKTASTVEVDDEDDSLWEESFGGHRDSKPFGPASVGMDIDFPGARHLYGIPEHASDFVLKTTTGPGAAYRDPYRLYNLDVFEYELDQPMALYGTIPVIYAHTAKRTVAAFWFSSSETFVDISDGGAAAGMGSHWISESGVVDLMLLPGPSPLQVFSQFTLLTGTQELPPLFALGYHQCRWNYKDEKDVATVHGKFEELDIPYDVLWLDIEHTDGKRYFTWDKTLFPNPIEMQNNVSAQGRKMVTIIDPHIKRDGSYRIHKEATDLGLYIKDKGGGDYDGWCWPGSSSYLDFTEPRVRQWWAEQFALDKYEGSTPDLFTWNDMNEPSVFNGPEVTMPKDCKSLDGVEHREWHNLYGMFFQRATAEGLALRGQATEERPFVLSRSFFAGSQRWGAIWTGDNAAEWSHLAIASSMLLTINVAGLSFAGADAGGFFGNTDAELMTRWIQAAAFTPFFRGHAHHDAKRREPWVFGEPHTTRLRAAIATRYTFLPYWYTVFAESQRKGTPVMRPLWAHYPADEATFAIEDEWLVGSDLLVKPVVAAGVKTLPVYFPGTESWYDVVTYATYKGLSTTTVDAPIEKIPVYQRGGSILPRKMRLRRSSAMMAHDPYTLVVAPDSTGKASGELYMDDERTFAFKRGVFCLRRFAFVSGVLTSGEADASGSWRPENTLERVVVLGVASAPTSVSLSTVAEAARELSFEYDSATKSLTIRKPDVLVGADWSIKITA